MLIFETIKSYLAEFYNNLFIQTNSYWLALIVYTALISLLFNVVSFPGYIRSNYSSFVKKKRKIIEKNNSKDYYAYKAELKEMYKAEKYHPTWYIGVIMFGIEYGLYVLLFDVVRKPLTYISGLGSTEVALIKNFFSRQEIKSEFKMIEKINLIPVGLLSDTSVQKLKIFTHKFTINGTSLASKPFELQTTGQKYWWILPLIILILFFAQIAIRLLQKRKNFNSMNTDKKVLSISLTIVPLLMTYSLYTLFFVQYMEIYFITLTVLNSIRFNIYRAIMPKDKVVDFVYRIKKINKEDTICPELKISSQKTEAL